MTTVRTVGQEAKLALADLRTSRGDVEVLRGITFTLPAATSLSVIGGAGSGKSVLLRAMCRMLDLDHEWRVSGSIKVDGEEVLGDAIDVARVRRRLGLVFSEPAVLPMSVFENVVFGLRAMGVREPRALEEAYERAMRRVMLWEQLGRQSAKYGRPISLRKSASGSASRARSLWNHKRCCSTSHAPPWIRWPRRRLRICFRGCGATARS